ncbi:YaaL family protein [Lutispora sp.]|uniref:YaaL family protein n=1 Tax=Lutispora sp. TaxID=2828727 RepID=UPI0035633B8B
MSLNLEVKQLLNMIPGFTRRKKKDNHEEFFAAIAKARQEWYDAQNYFENVVEEDLIDHAIYKIEAARAKYVYMLKHAKQCGIKMDL